MRRISNLFLIVVALRATAAHAGQIRVSAFSPAATVQTFESLGLSIYDYTTPMQIGNDTYDGDGHHLAASAKFSFSMGRPSGIALGNDPDFDSQTGFIEI